MWRINHRFDVSAQAGVDRPLVSVQLLLERKLRVYIWRLLHIGVPRRWWLRADLLSHPPAAGFPDPSVWISFNRLQLRASCQQRDGIGTATIHAGMFWQVCAFFSFISKTETACAGSFRKEKTKTDFENLGIKICVICLFLLLNLKINPYDFFSFTIVKMQRTSEI